MGSLGAMVHGSKDRYGQQEVRDDTQARARGHRGPRARSRARSPGTSTSSWAVCAPAWATAARRRVDGAAEEGAVRPRDARRPAREPSARRHDHEGSAELRRGAGRLSALHDMTAGDRGDRHRRFRVAVRAVDRAPRSASTRSSAGSSRPRRAPPISRARRCAGIILSGGPASRLRRGRADDRSRHPRARRPRARHLLRHAAAGATSSGRRSRRRTEREFGRQELEVLGTSDLFAGTPRAPGRLDEPRRPRRDGGRATSRSSRGPRRARPPR